MASHGIEEIDATGHIGGVKDAGLADRLGDQGFGGEVHDGVDFMLRENSLELRAVR